MKTRKFVLALVLAVSGMTLMAQSSDAVVRD